MTDPEPQPAKNSAHVLIGLGIVLLFLIIGSVIAFLQLDWKAQPEPILASARFADGLVVEVLRSDLTHKMRIERITGPGLLERLKLLSQSNATHASSRMTLSTEIRNGSFYASEFAFQGNEEPALFLILRGRYNDGSSLKNRHFLSFDGLQEVQRQAGKQTEFSAIGQATSQDISTLELHLQVEDGAGGWRDLVGPLMPDTKDGRAFAAVDAFPRRSPQLRLKLLHAGESPIEIMLPNPGYKPSFPTLMPQKLPVTYNAGDFQLTCNGLKWNAGKSRLEPYFSTKLQATELPPDCFKVKTLVFDETGNHHLLHRQPLVYLPLPSEKHCRLVCQVERELDLFPWPESEVTIIAEGIMAATPTEQTALITSDGRQRGCKAISFRPPATSSSRFPHGFSSGLNFIIQGELSKLEQAALENEYEWGQCAVFSQAPHSIGVCEFESCGHSTTQGLDVVSFKLHSQWKGNLKPGAAFRIGLIKKQKPVEIEFMVEVPEKAE
jgi:hypothetical protein